VSVSTPTLDDQVRMLHLTMETFAEAKRFNERWIGDPGFRSSLFRDPAATLDRFGLDLQPDDLRGIIDVGSGESGSIARGMIAITTAKSSLMKQWYGPDATTGNARIDAWRGRQAKRMRLELGPFPANSAIRGAWQAELTRGCSGGCWFCNMAAGPLEAHAGDTPAALDEWRQIVRALGERLGPAIRTGFLDGASDPFDHPGYERFASAVHDEAGFYPPTATALALRDPERTRRFFQHAKEAGCWSIRLTVRSLDELDALHEAFSSDELSHVQVNAMTPESPFVFSLAGRFRDRYLSDETFATRERAKLRMAPWYTVDPSYVGHDRYPFDGNTALVGFSIDMVGRTVALVAPRSASDAFPLGLQVLERRAFDGPATFADGVDALVDRWMHLELPGSAQPRFPEWLEIERLPAGVRLHGRFNQAVDIEGDAGMIAAMAETLRNGAVPVHSLASHLGAGATEVRATLQRFLEAGVIDDEAAP